MSRSASLRTIAFASVLMGLLAACDSASAGPGADPDPGSDNSAVVSLVVYDDGSLPAPSIRSSARMVNYDQLRVSFRSSGVDFFSVGDFTTVNPTAEVNIPFADSNETLIFSAGETVVEQAPSATSVTWDAATYDMIRLDIGRGEFTFTLDGQEIFVGNSEDSDRNSWSNSYGGSDQVVYHNGDPVPGEFGDAFVSSGINANSIVLVDSSELAQPILVPRNQLRSMSDPSIYWYDADGDVWDWDGDDSLDPNTVMNDFSSAYFLSLPSVVQAILREGREFKAPGDLDMDGALFIPFNAVTIPTDVRRVRINITWAIEDSIVESGDDYVMSNRVAGTAFDFEVQLVVE